MSKVGSLRQQAQSPAADSPERIAQGRESVERLHEALTRLPADQVQVFCLRYFEQMSNQEIAAVLTTNANRVGVCCSAHAILCEKPSTRTDTGQLTGRGENRDTRP